jgi:hydroxymethylglutaryl-CoA lyase
MKWNLPKRVELRDITCRDGFQHESSFIPTETKLYFLEALAAAGFRWLEATSFAHPKFVPQFSDAEDLLKQLKKKPGVVYNAITLNERALDRCLKTVAQGFGPDLILYMISTSESHNRRNAGRPREEMWAEAPRVIHKAKAAGLQVIGTIGTTFGCPIEGPVPIATALEFADRFRELGVDELNFGDTTGEGTPDRVFDFYSQIVEKHQGVRIVAHFHESRGWGLANCLAALLAGVFRFDVSMGGLGGQPAKIVDRVPIQGTGELYTPSDLTGNVRGEDLAVMLEEMNLETGLDLDRYLALGRLLERVLGRPLRSWTTQTGRIPKGPTGR